MVEVINHFPLDKCERYKFAVTNPDINIRYFSLNVSAVPNIAVGLIVRFTPYTKTELYLIVEIMDLFD